MAKVVATKFQPNPGAPQALARTLDRATELDQSHAQCCTNHLFRK